MNIKVERQGRNEMDDLKQCLDDHMLSAVGAMLNLQVAVRRASDGDASAMEGAEHRAETTMREYELVCRRVCGLVKGQSRATD